jgi:hypothetical protein
MERLSGAATATTMTAIDDVHEPSQSNSASASASAAGLEDGECISATVLQKQVASGNDAMDILFDAAAHAGSSARVGNGQATVLDDSDIPFDIGSEDNVLRVWDGCRFVKMGWFTAEEALSYTDWSVGHPEEGLRLTVWQVLPQPCTGNVPHSDRLLRRPPYTLLADHSRTGPMLHNSDDIRPISYPTRPLWELQGILRPQQVMAALPTSHLANNARARETVKSQN